MAKAPFRSKVLLGLVTLGIVPLLILTAEGLTRLLMGHVDPLSVFIASPQLRSDTQGEQTRGLFEFDPALTWQLRSNLREQWWDFTTVTTNAAHLRMAREVGPKKGLRIVCLGDSVTFGYRVPVVHDRDKPADFDPSERPYPALLEDALRSKFPGKEIEVLPLACPGYSSGQGLAWLKRDLATFQPDIVTACFGWNDARASGLPDRMTFPHGDAQIRVRQLMAHSQLLLHLAQGAQAKRAPDVSAAEPRSSAEEFAQNFREMNSAARANGGWFGVILPIYRDPNSAGDYPEGNGQPGDPEEAERIRQYRGQLQAVATQEHFPALLVPELTEVSWPKNAEFFGERIHPNAAGHRLLAERLATFLQSEVEKRLR
jgi:lysophospholipase L1-like esterase